MTFAEECILLSFNHSLFKCLFELIASASSSQASYDVLLLPKPSIPSAVIC